MRADKRNKRVASSTTHRKPLDSMIASLRFAGLWIRNGESATGREFFYKIYNKIVIAIISIFAITVFADLCLNYDDLIVLTDDACILAGICVIIFKMFVFHARSERIKSIIENIHDPVVSLNRSTEPKVRMLVQRCTFYENILLHAFWTVGAILSIALLFLVPVEKGQLPIRAKYPFDIAKSPMHQIAFSLQACAVCIGLISIVGMDSIVVGLYKWTAVQLVVLNANYENCPIKSRRATFIKEQPSSLLLETFDDQNQINNNNDITCFVPFSESEARVDGGVDSFVQRFKLCITHHQRIIRNVDELNDIFGVSMFAQLFASFSMICFTGFQAVLGSKNISSLAKFCVYLGAAFSQLLNWCWNGNALAYQSASLTTSQWLSGWEDDISADVVSLMIISLMRSKRPLSLKAGKFYSMSMETFISILRNSYSFFALLTQINETAAV